jgi:hypothetical protein
VALPRAYAPTSIALRIIGACIPPFYDKAVVLEEKIIIIIILIINEQLKYSNIYNIDLTM